MIETIETKEMIEAVQDLKEKMIETIETKEMIEAESSKKNLLKKEENF